MQHSLHSSSIRIAIVPVEQVWQLRHEVMWPDRELDYVKLADDDAGTHYGLFIDDDHDQPVSVISLFVQGSEAQFRKFATRTSHQGNGYGSRLLDYIVQEAARLGVSRLYCNARTEKTAFYETFGLQPTTNTFQKGGKSYVIMERWMQQAD
ncbi:GNAT family N-acetyltransferase [Paenibacillus kandeliae]|uniref:GNAT family N-acetyltransferase n=1 Tax=Paenibacillus kandeliae TaxID=3231269 RepID=UPI003457A058